MSGTGGAGGSGIVIIDASTSAVSSYDVSCGTNGTKSVVGTETLCTYTTTGSDTYSITGSSTNAYVRISTTNDNALVDDSLFYNYSQTVTPNSPQVKLEGQMCSSGQFSHGVSTLQTTTQGSYNLGWTPSATTSTWSEIAIELIPASSTPDSYSIPIIATTTYAYDALNNLASTTDSMGNVRHFSYDGLGRRTSAEDFHEVGDGTFGTWSFTYDDQGNVTSQTDPKGQVVNRTYDALNRMLTEDYTGEAGTEVTNTYDSCTNGIGRLCSASSTSAISTSAYDILGRQISATTTVLGTSVQHAIFV